MLEELENEEYIGYQRMLEIKKSYEKLYRDYRKRWFCSKKVRQFLKDYQILFEYAQKHNYQFLEKKYDEQKNFFDHIRGRSLDKDQAYAVLQEADNSLIIAGAGSGKTLTMVAKIKYLIEIKSININNILCISFTNASVLDFQKAVLETCGQLPDVFTFHRLGLEILKMNKIKTNIVKETKLIEIIEEEMNKLCSKPFSKDIKRYIISTTDENTQNREIKEIKKLIATFINFAKANNFKLNDMKHIKKEIDNEINPYLRKRNLFLLKQIIYIWEKYEHFLEENVQIDFHDMITQSTDLLRQNGYIKPYQYIIIDEYQDTSLARYELLHEIQNQTHCKVIAVGDDFQSIYRFTGCTLNIFTNFEQYYPGAEIFYISTTYRNSQQLIDVAGDFIMKNKKQIHKTLKSPIMKTKPIKIYYYQNQQEIDSLLSKIDAQEITILGRNNEDINFLKNNPNYVLNKNKIINKSNLQKAITYMTVHRSKGLESEVVIIINLEDKLLGFPNKIADDPILHYLSQTKESFPYDEERRLFYVALTRAKKEVYLFVSKKRPSIFVSEIIKDNQQHIEILKK